MGNPGPVTINAFPFLVGETIPGYCHGLFYLSTMGHTLRVEAVGVDWVVLRDQDTGTVQFYEGTHERLREAAAYTERDRRQT